MRVGLSAPPWVLPLAGLGAVVAVALLAGWAGDPDAVLPQAAFAPPGSPGAWLGRDELGRSVLARTADAAGRSVTGALLALLIGWGLAALLGGLAGFNAGSWLDRLVTWLSGALMVVPAFLVVLVIAAVLRPGFHGCFAIVGLVLWPPGAQLVRQEILRLREHPSVRFLRASGMPEGAILGRVLLPAGMAPGFLALLLLFPELLGFDVALSFFGLGAQPPTATLGREVFRGLGYAGSAWWMWAVPAAALLGLGGIVFALASRLRGAVEWRGER